MDAGKKYGFSKKERLSGRKDIGKLFSYGKTYFSHPFNLVWTETGGGQDYPARVCISVSKKSFKRASDRNRIKRLIRESWRHEKNGLYLLLEKHNLKISVMLIYISADMPSQQYIRNKMSTLVSGFINHLETKALSGEKNNCQNE